jgi:hypothetical protein
MATSTFHQHRAAFLRLLRVTLVFMLISTLGGCAFGPRALEGSHHLYNDSIKRVGEEELLLNLVRLRYNEALNMLDVASIAAQYELNGSVQAQPFLAAAGSNASSLVQSFARVLPGASLSGANRPTITMTPVNSPQAIERFFRPITLEGLAFLTGTTWPVSTTYRLWVEYINRVPNAVTASGPPREFVPEYQEFRRLIELLQINQDRGYTRVVPAEKVVELGDPLPPSKITAADIVEAAKHSFKYIKKKDENSWVLTKRQTKLVLKINPMAVNSPEVIEAGRILHLKSGLPEYDYTDDQSEPFPALAALPELVEKITISPRSTVGVLQYLSHGVVVPSEHLISGVAQATIGPDGNVFDWRNVTEGLFVVYHASQHHRPHDAYVAIKYRDYWFYIDDRDQASKQTFCLMMQLIRLDVSNPLTSEGGVQKTPVLTLPVGR